MKAHFDSVQPSSVAGLSIVFGRLSFSLARLFDRFYLWQIRRAGRHHLQGLDDRLLRDIGLSRADAVRASLSGGTDPDTPGRR